MNNWVLFVNWDLGFPLRSSVHSLSSGERTGKSLNLYNFTIGLIYQNGGIKGVCPYVIEVLQGDRD